MNDIDLGRRVTELEYENEALRAIVAQLTDPPFRVAGLTPAENKILGALYRSSGIVAKRTIFDLIYCSRADGGPNMKILDVLMCKIRKKVRPIGVKIETVWGDGWRMPPESKKNLLAARSLQ